MQLGGKGVCITWRWSLHKDMNSVLWLLGIKGFEELSSRLEFLLVVAGYTIEKNGQASSPGMDTHYRVSSWVAISSNQGVFLVLISSLRHHLSC